MSSDLPIIAYLTGIVVISLFVNMGISLYGVFAKPSLIKKLIALTILSDTANVFAILVGYRRWPPGSVVRPPVLTELPPTPEKIARFASTAVDPLPQALVLTAIVIGLAVIIFLAVVIMQIYRTYGTTDVRIISKLRGERR